MMISVQERHGNLNDILYVHHGISSNTGQPGLLVAELSVF